MMDRRSDRKTTEHKFFKKRLFLIFSIVVIAGLLYAKSKEIFTQIPVAVLHKMKNTHKLEDTAKLQAAKSQDIKIMYTSPKKILFYTEYFQNKIWWDYEKGDYGIQKCPISNCIVTYDRNEMNRSDAVFFHALERPYKEIVNSLLAKRRKNQVLVWSVWESPMNVPKKRLLDSYNNVFNWTATFRQDSDITIPYYKIVPLQQKTLFLNKIKKTNYAAKKNKLIVAAISNCVSDRINFIKNLKKFVSFDLFGNCGPIVSPELKPCGRSASKCLERVSKYKFYFAMENTFCKDYVTEKMYHNGLIQGLVPIVFGGSGGPDFTNNVVAPPKSYINVFDFENMRSLADYLKYLDKNDTAYNEYHEWRNDYSVIYYDKICDVCKALWNPPKKQTGRNLSDFYDRSKYCKEWSTLLKKYE